MRRRGIELLGATAFAVAFTALVTWPQIVRLDDVLQHHDVYFSIWRLAWVAHALGTAPWTLLDANIFHPAPGTLAYSDAMLLQGLIAAPFFWAGMSPVLVYNLMMLIGYAGSGVAMFVLVRHLTGEAAAGLASLAIFTIAPYRVEHNIHLELQWVMWVPLAFWALHRAVAERSTRFAVAAGVFIWLQLLSCVYYGVLLGLLLVVFVPALLLLSGRAALPGMKQMLIAGAVAMALALPYVWIYKRAADVLGGRAASDIAAYSAHLHNYLASTIYSRLWGWTADRWGASELRLFPGLMSIVLALVALVHRTRRSVALYTLLTIAAVVLSLGVNTPVYRWVLEHVSLLGGLRALARAGILAVAALAVLAGFGVHAIIERWRPTWKRAAGIATLLLLIAADGATRPFDLQDGKIAAEAPVYKIIRAGEPGPVLEIPLPRLTNLPGWDAYYSLWSIYHWQPLINGYSGFYPNDYMQTMVRMESFPDDASVARLRSHGVRYIVLHRAFMEPERYTGIMLKMAERSDFRPMGNYPDAVGSAALWILQ